MIKAFSFRQLFKLFGEFISKPFFILPTYRATKKTLKICNECYGKEHHKNNSTNAFKHALWNYLLCEEYYKVSSSIEVAHTWSKKITDLHEKISPNREIAKAMDLHNNFIGRELFSEADKNLDIREHLNMMAHRAKQVNSIEEIVNSGHQLVFLED